VTRARIREFAPLGGVILLGALVGGTLVYRSHYNVWPGQAADSRVTWCGRHYNGGGGPAESLRQIQATYDASYKVAGGYPPLGLTRSQVVARGCGPQVPTVIFLSVSPDRYTAYGLAGAP
jgi:hypothetical protein